MRITPLLLLIICLCQACNNHNTAHDAIHPADSTGSNDKYVCLPCGYGCDSNVSDHPGTCDDCRMPLVKQSGIVFNNIKPVDLYEHIRHAGASNVLLLDVRTPAEFNGEAEDKFGRLRNAVNIPVQELEKRISEIEGWKQKEVIVYCSHSHRSPAASYQLSMAGFSKVYNLQYGMHKWKEQVTDKTANDSLFVAQ